MSKMQFEKRQKSFIPIACMDLRRGDAAASCDERHPQLDGGNLIAKLPASGGLWGEVGSRVGASADFVQTMPWSKFKLMALTGTYERTMDDKLRLAIPRPLRDGFPGA